MCVCVSVNVCVLVCTHMHRENPLFSVSLTLSHFLAVSDPWMWGGGMERKRRTTKFWGDGHEVGRVHVADAPSRAPTQEL